MLSNLPVLRSPGALFLFGTASVVTAAILLWADSLAGSGAHGLTRIFWVLFATGDYAGANCALLILVAAAAVAGRHSFRPVLRWFGDNPMTVAAAAVVVLAGGTLLVYDNAPLCMDEYSPYFQSQTFAAGHLAGQVPVGLLNWVVPPGFQDYFLNVSHSTGQIASAYWPSFALLLTPFVRLGIPWACNPLISALTLLAVHRLALRIFADREAAGIVVLLTVASPVFFANGISYYSMPAHLLANTVFALLLVDPTERRALAAGMVGSIALTLHNPVPHLLFAAPWVFATVMRPGGRRTAGYLLAGYLPLCLLLGVGWFLFSSNLTHEGAIVAGAGSAGDSLLHLRSAFALPSSTIMLARAIGIAKLWIWAVPGLLLLAVTGAWKWRHSTPCLLLTLSAMLTLMGYLFVPFDQGHGWGFRYFHSTWMALPILAAGALTRLPNPVQRGRTFFEDSATLTFFVACALITLVVGNGFRALQMRAFIEQHQSQIPAYLGKERRVVIIDPSLSSYRLDLSYGLDLVQNDPWLRGPVVRMITHGAAADSDMMHGQFPHMRVVYTDQFGSVWSARQDSLQ
jgi:hypothetical protein